MMGDLIDRISIMLDEECATAREMREERAFIRERSFYLGDDVAVLQEVCSGEEQESVRHHETLVQIAYENLIKVPTSYDSATSHHSILGYALMTIDGAVDSEMAEAPGLLRGKIHEKARYFLASAIADAQPGTERKVADDLLTYVFEQPLVHVLECIEVFSRTRDGSVEKSITSYDPNMLRGGVKNKLAICLLEDGLRGEKYVDPLQGGHEGEHAISYDHNV
jgi:hypothetical protein